MHAPCAYAERLLAALPPLGVEPPVPRLEHPALAWARSGAMALTGRADEPPRLAPAPLATCAAGALDALRALAPGSRLALDATGADASDRGGAALLGRARRLRRARPPRLGLRRREAATCCARPTAGSR